MIYSILKFIDTPRISATNMKKKAKKCLKCTMRLTSIVEETRQRKKSQPKPSYQKKSDKKIDN